MQSVPEGLSRATVHFDPTQHEALSKLRDEMERLNQNAAVNRSTLDLQFGKSGRVPPVVEDAFYKLYGPEGVDPAALVNTDATGALAAQMSRLEGLYPGITSRMLHYSVGRVDPYEHTLAWYNNLGRAANKPGNVFYEIGSPGEASAMRAAIGPQFRASNGSLLSRNVPTGSSDWLAARGGLYDSQLDATMAHELGHATHYTMTDFAKGLGEQSQMTGAARDMGALNSILGGGHNADISGYAADASAIQRRAGASQFAAAREPFAELFSVARSPAGMDINSGNLDVRRAAIKQLISDRSPRQAEGLMDKVGLLNQTEKNLRNEGFNEVGSLAPDLALQLGLPALAGLMASKTHGNVKAALSGAAFGGGLGSMAGPEGTLIGGALGAGAGLARQLL